MTARNWLPSDGDSLPTTWIDPSDAATVTADAGAAVEVADKGSGGTNATQSTEASRPAITQVNGLDALGFDGVDDFMTLGAAVLDLNHTIFVVAVPTNEAQVTAIYGQYVAGVAGRHAVVMNQTDNALTVAGVYRVFNISFANGVGANGRMNDYPVADEAVTLISQRSASGLESFKSYKDGAENESLTISSVQQTAFGIGAENGNGAGALGTYNGKICELVAFDAALSDAQRQLVEGYLAWKWGFQANLPETHPYFSEAPQFEESAPEPDPVGTFVPWTPADLDAQAVGFRQWWDIADTESITESGGEVEEVLDRLNTIPLFQASQGARPRIDTATMNQIPVLDFASGDFMESNVDWHNNVTTGDTTIFWVGGGVGWGRGLDGSPGAPGTGWNVQVLEDTFSVVYTGPTTAAVATPALSGLAGVETFRSISIKNTEPREQVFWGDGQSSSVALANFNLRSDPTLMQIGRRGNASQFDPGTLAEMLVFEGAIDSETRQLIEGYLAWKWGLESRLPISHPYRDRAPGEFINTGATGQITGTLTVNGDPAVREIIGISYAPQTVVTESGDPIDARIVVGETVSADDGNYTLGTGAFTDEVIVLVLEDYGRQWDPNRLLEVGDRVRPTQPNQNGYIYVVTLAGNSGAEEPTEWLIPTGGQNTMQVGGATVEARPMFWSIAHAPILPTVVGAPVRPWTPLDAPLIQLIDPDDIDSHAMVGTRYATAADASGNARNFVQTTDSQRPQVLENFLGSGLRAMDFPGPRWMDAPFPDNQSEFAIVFVGIRTGAPSNPFQNVGIINAIAQASSSPGSRYTQIQVDDVRWGFRATLGGPSTVYTEDATPVNGEGAIITAHVRMGGISLFRFNGKQIAEVDNSSDSPVNGVQNRLGQQRWTATQLHFVGAIGYYVILDAPTADDVERTEGFIAHRFGINQSLDASHAHRDSPPTKQPDAPADVDPFFDDVVLLLPFDTDLNDVSATGAQGQAFDDAAIDQGELVLDGTGDRVFYAANSAFSLAGAPFTIEGFINPGSVSSNIVLAALGATISWTTGNLSYLVYLNGGALEFQVKDSDSTPTTYSGGAVQTSVRQHYAICFDGTDISGYLRGERVFSGPATPVVGSATPAIEIGRLGTAGLNYVGRVSAHRITANRSRYAGETITVPESFPTRGP